MGWGWHNKRIATNLLEHLAVDKVSAHSTFCLYNKKKKKAKGKGEERGR